MSDRPLISVIIPMYNVEKYIADCLQSLIKQKFVCFEAIIVNDGTKDLSKEIAQKVIKDDPRFRIVDKENGGLSSARNYGLKSAKGDFIVFVDSDDYVSDNYLTNLYNGIISNDGCEIAISRIMYVNENDKRLKVKSKTQDAIVVSKNVAMRKMLLRDDYNHCAYGKLYKASLWENMCFPEGRLYEDYLTTYFLFNKVNKVAMIDSQDYFYVQRQGSIMHGQITEKALDVINVSDEVTEWIATNNKTIYTSALELKMATYLKTLQKIMNNDDKTYVQIQEKIKLFVNDNLMKVLFYLRTPFRDRVKFLLYMISPMLFLKIYNRYSGD